MDIFIINPESGYDYSVLMQNIGLGLLAVFTPLAIFLLDNKLSEIDKIVILSYVLKIKWLALNIIFIFLSQFLYKFDVLKVFVFILFFIGCYNIIKILCDSYRWFSTVPGEEEGNFRNITTDKYFNENRNWKEKEKIWTLTWQGDIKIGSELNRIEKFINDIQKLLKEGDLENVNSYLRIFNEFLEKRHLDNWNLFSILWSKSLDWYFNIYSSIKSSIEKNNFVFQLEGTVLQILDKLFLSAILKNNAFLCFKELKTHIAKKNTFYLEKLFLRLSDTFFENVEKSGEKHEIWSHYFPSEWKITYTNLNKEGNNITKIWENRFFNWAIPRFGNNINYDSDLDGVVRGIFPHAETIIWSHILHFYFTPWSNDKKMISKLEQRQNFGAFGHSYTSINQDDKNHTEGMILTEKIEREEAFRLAQILLGYNETQIEEILRDLRLVEDIKLKRERDLYIRIFEEMLKFIKENPN